MSKKAVNTVPHGKDWANRREDSNRISKKFSTKAEAQAAGRATAMREGVEHIIHRQDGTISERNSYGKDPHPPKG